MEFARRIGDLSQLARRVGRLQAEKARARRQLSSSRFALPISDNLEGERMDGRLSRSLLRQRDAALGNRAAQVRCSQMQDQLLLRRIPVAISALERSWVVLDRKQRERQEKRRERNANSVVSPDSTRPLAAVADPALDGLETMTLASLQSAEAGLRCAASMQVEDVNSAVPAASGSSLPAVTPSPQSPPASRQHVEATHLLLQLLHTLEQARRQHLRDKLQSAQQRSDSAEKAWHSFQKEFAAPLRQHRQPRGKPRKAESLTAEDHALLQETADTLQRRRRAARDDVAVLQSSLLARPYVSARLWRLLLRESVWTAAVAEHRRATALGGAGSHGNAVEASRLLSLCLALSRITMGILRDYVQGGSLSRQSPRFVVSLPSRAFRKRIEGGEGEKSVSRAVTDSRHDDDVLGEKTLPSSTAAAAPHEDDDADADPLLAMLQDAAETPIVAPASTSPVTRRNATPPKQKTRKNTAASRMRWIPPHTADVLPLVTDTLALHSLVLPELNVPVLLQLGCAAEVVSLCVTLQMIATTTLALAADGDNVRRTLRSLEAALRDAGDRVVTSMTAELTSPSSSETPLLVGRASTPEEAARFAVQLHALRLLPTNNPAVEPLLARLLTDIFPELRTQTSRVLQEKARQSSLLAFATRPHRQKLYQQHGRPHAERYLLGTVVQQARLQQRQLTAALREQRLTEVHVQTLSKLGDALPASDLVQLFQLYARHASQERGTGESAATSANADLWLTGCLFLAETILLSDSTHGNAAAAATSLLTLTELAALWDAAALLFPHIRTRRSQKLAQQRAVSAGRSRAATSAAHTESIIWATFAEHLVSALNGALAERLQVLEEQRAAESVAMRRHSQSGKTKDNNTAATAAALPGVPVDAVVAMAAGILEYATHDEALRQSGEPGSAAHTSASLQPLQQSVRMLSRLLQDLVLHDRALWHRVRRLPEEQREAMERQLLECFHTLGLLDATTTQALQMLSKAEAVAV